MNDAVLLAATLPHRSSSACLCNSSFSLSIRSISLKLLASTCNSTHSKMESHSLLCRGRSRKTTTHSNGDSGTMIMPQSGQEQEQNLTPQHIPLIVWRRLMLQSARTHHLQHNRAFLGGSVLEQGRPSRESFTLL